MAKTVRVVNRKRSSHKKNRAAIGKKSKVARRNRMSRRRNRVKRGGASWIEELQRNNLMMVWNSLFYERAKTKEDFKTKFVKTTEYRQASNDQSNLPSKVLFVIDMQNDFIDRPYTRTSGDVHPIFGNPDSVGNFDVADGRRMLDENSEFLKFIEYALGDASPYSKVVFTRDYHPVGHSSFSGLYNQSPILMCTDCTTPINQKNYPGNFPAHCVQGFEGSKLVTEIEQMIENSPRKDKETFIKILFKGMHKNIDSFTAVGKDVIDTISSNPTHKICTSCSSITGGYKLYNSNGSKQLPLNVSVTYNGQVLSSDQSMKITNDDMSKYTSDNTPTYIFLEDNFRFVKENYEWLDGNITTIEVCGLAGDYCVRDTVVALAQKYPTKQIVLLNDFTRYPALPFFSIDTLAQHKPESKYGFGDYDYTKSLASLDDKEIAEFMISDKYIPDDSANQTKSGIEDGAEQQPTEEEATQKKMSVLSQYAKSETENKDIIYYLLKKNLATGERTLIDKEDLKDVDTKELTTQHFITPLESFIEDYNKDNIQIVMSWIDKQST